MSSQILEDPEFRAKVGSCLLVLCSQGPRPLAKESPDGPSQPFLSFDEVEEGR